MFRPLVPQMAQNWVKIAAGQAAATQVNACHAGQIGAKRGSAAPNP
jgi:hypothetical protein